MVNTKHLQTAINNLNAFKDGLLEIQKGMDLALRMSRTSLDIQMVSIVQKQTDKSLQNVNEVLQDLLIHQALITQ